MGRLEKKHRKHKSWKKRINFGVTGIQVSTIIVLNMTTDPVERSWDLSLYELRRTPQEAITDDTEIAVSARSLQSELTCPICLDMLTNTMTTKECLHRFCAECIVTALRAGNKECPTCRKKLISKRSLRPDPNFDQLVSKIYPDKEDCDEEQEKARFVHAKRICKKRHLAEEVNVASSAEEEGDCARVRVRLTVHSEMKEDLKSRVKQKERSLETVASATVGHVMEYVKVRLGIELGLQS